MERRLEGVTLPWFDAWLDTMAFGLKIILKFLGYSDMANRLARAFGIKSRSLLIAHYRAGSIIRVLVAWAHYADAVPEGVHCIFAWEAIDAAPGGTVFNIMVTMPERLWHGQAGLK